MADIDSDLNIHAKANRSSENDAFCFSWRKQSESRAITNLEDTMHRITIPKLTARASNVVVMRPKNVKRSTTEPDITVKVLGKLCPCCSEAGAVLCETKKRIIYECPNSHQYETKKRLNDLYSDRH